MGNKKKLSSSSKTKQSSTTITDCQSSRQPQLLSSSAQRQKKSSKKRKSKNSSTILPNDQQQITQDNYQANQLNTQININSPQKTYINIDNNNNNNNNNLIRNKQQDALDQQQQVNQSSTIKQGRPFTSVQNSLQQQSQLQKQDSIQLSQIQGTQIIQGGAKNLMPLANNRNQIQQQINDQKQQQSFQSVNNGQQQMQMLLSPVKNNSIIQLKATNQSQFAIIQGSLQPQNVKPILQSHQQQQQPLKTQQFQHLIAGTQHLQPSKFSNISDPSKNFQQAHQVGINGLLNMTKQRGLIQSQTKNIIPNNQTRSQSSQKQQVLQNNGSKIVNGNKQVYNSINGQEEQVKLYVQNPQYHYAIHNQQAYMQQQINQQSNSLVLVPQQRIMQQSRILVNQGQSQQSIMMQQSAGRGNNKGKMGQQSIPGYQPNNKYYYFDQTPVQISGKQIGFGLMSGTINLQQNQYKQDRTPVVKKSSQTMFQQHPYQIDQMQSQLSYQYDQQFLLQEELMKQALLQELIDTQAIPNHLLQQLNINGQYQIDSNFIAKNSYLQQIIAQTLSERQQSINDGLKTVKESLHSSSNVIIPGQYKKSKIPFSNAYVEDCYKFIVVPGNNSGLIRKAIERRDWWIEIPPVHSLYNFKWQPVSYGIKFERLSPKKTTKNDGTSEYSSFPVNGKTMSGDGVDGKQMVNHFEFHQLITEKANLFNIMKQQCESQKENIFDLCPLTFYIEIPDPDKPINSQSPHLQQFLSVYQSFEDNKGRMREIEEQIRDYSRNEGAEEDENSTGESSNNNNNNGINNKDKEFLQKLNNKNQTGSHSISQKVTKFKTFTFDKRSSTKYQCPLSHYSGFNLWLLKPTHLNRGRGIHVFRELEDLYRLMKEYSQGKDEEVKTTTKKKNENGEEEGGDDQLVKEEEEQPLTKKKSAQSPKKNNSNNYKIKHNTFIIQKYIERPLLLCSRKFDIRVWVLLTQDYDLLMFKEGYLRTSSSEYNINLDNVDDQYVHLTNNAVQKYSENYGQFEDGNQLGYRRFQEIIDQQSPGGKCHVNVKEDIVPQMKEQIIKSMNSVRKKIDPFRRNSCFELFGYDFILDQDYNVWLIEVNTNPCIEESSELLKILLPRMIEDMLRLTMDQVFPKIKKKNNIGGKQSNIGSPQKNLTKGHKLVQNASQTQSLDKIPEEELINGDTIENENIQKQKPEENSKPLNPRIHPVPGYSDTENMWDKLWNLDKADPPVNKYPNFRSEFLINAGDKQFKIKRNPLYKKIQKEINVQIEVDQTNIIILQKDGNN